MAAKEARLILRLVDGVSGPANGIVSSLGRVNSVVRSINSVALAPTRALNNLAKDVRRRVNDISVMSTGLVLASAEVAKNVYELEKQLNISEAAGELNKAQRLDLLKEAVRLNGEYAATATDIVAGANEILKAGRTYEQMMGMLTGVLDTAQAMGEPIAEASAAIVDSMVSQKMAMNTTAESMASAIKMADLYAHAVAETTASLEDFRTSSKYFNPVAAAMGMSPEETMGWQIALARAGIKGSSAGTGLRSAPVSVAAPTKGGRAAFARLGLDPASFVGKRTGDADGNAIAAALEAAGYSSEGIEAEIDRLLTDPALKASGAKMAQAIIGLLGDELGAVTGEDRSAISQIIQDTLTAGMSEVDLIGALKALKAKGAGIGDYTAIFGKQHASKMMAIDPAEFDKIMAEIEEKSVGRAKRMREKMMQGIVRDWNELTASIEAMGMAIGQAGLLGDAARVLQSMAKSLDHMAQMNPDLLRFGAYAVLAVAALAPLGWALSGIAASLALVANPLTWVVGGLAYLAAINFDAITQFLSSAGSVFTSQLNPEILEGVAAGLDGIKQFFASMDSDGYNAQWASWASTLGGGAAEGINATYDGLKKLGDAMSAIAANGTVQAFASSMGSLFGMIREAGGAAGRILGEIATETVAFGKSFMDNLSPGTSAQIETWLQNVFNAYDQFYAKMAGIFSAIDIDLSGSGEALGKWAADAVNGIVNAFAMIDLTEIGRGMMIGLLTGLQAGIDEIISRITGLGDQIRSALGLSTEAQEQERLSKLEPMPDMPLWEANSNLDLTAIEQQSQQAEQIVQQALSPTGTPQVNTSMIDAAIAKAVQLKNLIGGLGGSSGSASSSGPAFGGPRASGGPVRRGLSYLVGEEGPELFTPGASGGITPNGALGGSVTNTFHISGGDPQAVAREVSRILDRKLGRSRQIGLDGRPTY